jgi:hypothetical protein
VFQNQVLNRLDLNYQLLIDPQIRKEHADRLAFIPDGQLALLLYLDAELVQFVL